VSNLVDLRFPRARNASAFVDVVWSWIGTRHYLRSLVVAGLKTRMGQRSAASPARGAGRRPVRPEVLDALAIQVRDTEVADYDVVGRAAAEDAAVAEPEASAKRPAERTAQHLGLLFLTNSPRLHTGSLTKEESDRSVARAFGNVPRSGHDPRSR
jgi:hypothetical protein